MHALKNTLLCWFILIGSVLPVRAQIALSDNFEDGTLTNTASITNPQWALSSAGTFVATTNASPASNLAGSFSLRSNTGNPAGSSPIMSTRFTTGGIGAVDYTWRLLYMNNGADPSTNTPSTGNRTWRLWLASPVATLAGNGYALTHQGNTLYLRRYSAGVGNILASCVIASNITYSIRVNRVASSGLWTMYVDTGTGEATTVYTGTTNTEITMATNVYTAFECNDVNTAGSFIWDNYSVSASSALFSYNSNSLAGNTLVAGDVNKAVFSFGVAYTEDLPVKTFTIANTAGLGNGQISGFTLVKSNNNIYGDADDTDLSGVFSNVSPNSGSATNNGNGFTFSTNIANGYVLPGTSAVANVYFFLVLNLSSSYVSTSGAFTFSMGSSGFVPANNHLVNTSGFTVSGGTYSFGKNYFWTGNLNNLFFVAGNWQYDSGVTATDVPGQYDNAQIGVKAYLNSANQPLLITLSPLFSAALGKVTFGTFNAPVLTVTSLLPGSLIIPGGITSTGAATISAANQAINLGSSGASSIGAVLTLDQGAYTNSGNLNITTAGAISHTGSVNGFTNNGAMTLSGSAAFLEDKDFTNSSTGTFIHSGAGTATFSGGQTITNNSATPVIFGGLSLAGSGTAALSGSGLFELNSLGALSVASGVTFAAGTAKLTLNSDANGTARVAQLPSSTAIITGTVTVERYFTGGSITNRGWRLLSSPVNNSTTRPATATATFNFNSLKTNLLITGVGGSIAGFDQPPGYTANGSTILYYTTATALFTWPTSLLTTPTRTIGTGFYFYFRGNNVANTVGKVIRSGGAFTVPEANVVGLQTGTLNQQAFNVTLSNAGRGYNLVGNPYASSISITAAALATGTTGFVYTYTPGGTSITARATPAVVASGQGFFIKANASTSNIAFTESLKTPTQPTASTTPPLLMGLPVTEAAPGNITLQLLQDSANYDFAQLRFGDNYKNTFYDMEDAEDLNGSGQAVFFGAMTSDKQLVAIASQPLNKEVTSVFLSVDDNTTGIYAIKKVDVSGISALYDIWLMDHFTKDSLDLRHNEMYNFNLNKNNPETFGNNRFEVIIRKKALPPYRLDAFAATKSGIAVLVKWNTSNEFDYTAFEVQKSLDGEIFEAVKNLQSSSKGSYNYNDVFADGVTKVYYRLKQTDVNDKVTYSAVVIVTVTGNGALSLYPNPASELIKFDINQSVKSSLLLNIYNEIGIRVKNGTFQSQTGQQDIRSLTTGSYTIEIIDTGTGKVVLAGKFIKI